MELSTRAILEALVLILGVPSADIGKSYVTGFVEVATDDSVDESGGK